MSEQKSHFYVGTVLLTYLKDDTMKQRYMNVFLEVAVKKIRMQSIHDVRIGATQRLVQENHVKPEDVKDFTIIGFTYCGLMTSDEFTQIQGQTEPSVH